MRKNASKIIAVGFLFLAFAFYLHTTNPVHAAGTHNVKGYAMSSNIGEINFSCDTDPAGCTTANGNYGVDIDATNVLTGQAWSENVGWVTFDSAYLNSCPTLPCTATFNPTTGNLSGWGKVCAGRIAPSAQSTDINNSCLGSDRLDKSDMWISLSGVSPAYQAKLNTTAGGNGSGYAWGSDVVGWLDFSNTKYEPTPLVVPSVTLSANGQTGTSSVPSGTTLNLTWSGNDLKTGATACNFIPGNIAGPVNNPLSTGNSTGINHGPLTNPPTTVVNYTIECEGTDNLLYSSSVTVNILPAGSAPTVVLYANNQPGTSNWSSGTIFTYTWSGSNLGASCEFSGNISGTIANPSPTGNPTGVSQEEVYNPPTTFQTIGLKCLGTGAYSAIYSPISYVTVNIFPVGVPTVTLTPWCYAGQGVISISTSNLDAGEACTGSAPWVTVPSAAESKTIAGGIYSLTCGGASSGSVTVPATPCVNDPTPLGPLPKKKPRFIEF